MSDYGFFRRAGNSRIRSAFYTLLRAWRIWSLDPYSWEDRNRG